MKAPKYVTVVEVGKLVLEEGGDVGADLGAKSQFLNHSEACSSPSTTLSITSSPPFLAEMAHGRRCCGAGWCRVLEDVGEDCMGLLAQVMFFSSTLFMQFGLIFPPGYLS